MAQRYGSLPSKIMAQADTFDVMILNTATGWEQYQSEKAQLGKGAPPTPNIPEEKLKEMMDKVRSKKK